MGKRADAKLLRLEKLRKECEIISFEAICKALRVDAKYLKQLIANGDFPLPLEITRSIQRWHIKDLHCFLWNLQIKQFRTRRPDHDEISRTVEVAQGYRKEKKGFVYFARGGEFVKIGYATNPQKRIYDLQTTCPFALDLIFSMPGTFQTEVGLHRRFKAHATSGEWFRWCDEIEQFIESMRSAGEQ